MARKKDSAKKLDWEAVMGDQEDFLRPLVEEIVQQVLEAEMDEALGPAIASVRQAGSAAGRAITAGRW